MATLGNVIAWSDNPIYTATGNGSTTAHTLTWTPPTQNSCQVLLDGIEQLPGTDYTISGTTLTFGTAPDSGVSILIRGLVDQGYSTVPASGSVTSSSFASGAIEGAIGSAFSFRNKIIGGDFTTNPWQRGTSFTGPTTQYTADRFYYGASSDAVVNIAKTADAPTAAQAGVFTQHCLHVDVTTADASLTANQVAYVSHKVEGVNSAQFGFGQAGTRYVTLSFWHKHTKTGTYCVSFVNSANTRSYVTEYTQDVTDTWEKAVITIPVDITGTWLYDSGVGINIWFAIGCSTSSAYTTTANSWQTTTNPGIATANQVNALDSTANNFKIALVQLEAGSVATPFESRPYGTELALCQRYYEKSYNQATVPGAADIVSARWGVASSTSNIGGPLFTVTKRSQPTMKYYSTGGTADKVSAYVSGSDVGTTVTSTAYVGQSSDLFIQDSGTGFTAGAMYRYHFTASSEL
jgi:hypothetical protein